MPSAPASKPVDHGNSFSLYCNDPEGNTLELSLVGVAAMRVTGCSSVPQFASRTRASAKDIWFLRGAVVFDIGACSCCTVLMCGDTGGTIVSNEDAAPEQQLTA